MLSTLALLGPLALAAPTDADDLSGQLWHELAGHHGPASCDDLYAGRDAEAVRDALIALATSNVRPPQAPMRAARCVLQTRPDDPVVHATAEAWMSDAALPGPALVVSRELAAFPEPVATHVGELAVARAATEPRFALHVRPVLAASPRPELAALALQIELPERSLPDRLVPR